MTATPYPLSARHKGFNRAEIVDQNFNEFVQLWQGDVQATPRYRKTQSDWACAALLPPLPAGAGWGGVALPARVKVVVASVMQPGAVFRYVVAW